MVRIFCKIDKLWENDFVMFFLKWKYVIIYVKYVLLFDWWYEMWKCIKFYFKILVV